MTQIPLGIPSLKDEPILSILMATYNRRSVTEKSLRTVIAQAELALGDSWSVILVDDASPDGTAEMARSLHSRISVVRGTGSLFWATSMALAEAAVHDARSTVLWLNDDVELHPDALERLLSAHRENPMAILVGACSDASGKIIYSGLRSRSDRPGALEIVRPAGTPVKVDTFHGNVVLVPASVRIALQGIDGSFSHAYADIDYGYRATRSGIDCLLLGAPLAVGTPNPAQGGFRDSGRTRRDRLALLFSRKGLPLRDHMHFMRTHGGNRWVFYIAASYLKAIFQALR